MRRGLVVVAVAGVLAVALLVLKPEPCPSAAERLKGVWDADRKFELQKSFGARRDALVQAQAALDAFAAEWTLAWTGMCAQPEAEVKAKAAVCLDGRRAELGALTEVLARADEAQLQTWAIGIERLTALEPCAQTARALPPKGKIARAELAVAQLKTARSEAWRRAGRAPEALVAANEAVDAARSAKDQPVLAEALLAKAEVLRVTGKPSAAEDLLTEAMAAAEAGQDPVAQVRVAIARVVLWTASPKRFADADAAAQQAEGLKPTPAWKAELDLAAAVLRLEQRRPAAAEALARAARAHFEAKQQWARRLDATGVLAQALTIEGKAEEAAALAQEALDGRAAMVGPDHPLTQRSRIFLAQSLLDAHQDARVLAVLEGLTETQLSTMPVASAAAALCCRATARTRLGQSSARDDAQRCLALTTTATGPSSAQTAQAHEALAEAWRLQKEDRKALGENEAAVSIYGAARSPGAGFALGSLAMTHLALGDFKLARAKAREGLSILDTVPAEHAIDPCPALWVFAEAGRRLKAGTAVAEARTALGCLGEHPGRLPEVARAALTLARALGKDPEAIGMFQKAARAPSPVQLEALDALAALKASAPEAGCAAAVEALVRERTDAREKAAKGCKLPRIH